MKDAPPATPDADLLDTIPSRKFLPGEDREAFEAFRMALLEELAPRRVYERQLAENLVELEWEAVRFRNLRVDLVTAETRDGCARQIQDSINDFSLDISDKSKVAASAAIGPHGPEKEAAMATLADSGTTLDEMVARAYAKEIGTLSHIDRHLAEIEPRRRRLLDDYERLKSKRDRDIPDAEIVDDHGD